MLIKKVEWVYILENVNICKYLIKKEAGRGAAARGVTVKPTGCGFDPHSRR